MKKIFLALLFARCAFAGWWIEGDYLLWTIKKNPLPAPIFTSASESDPLPGAIGQPGTRVLLGQNSIGMGWMNGFRVALGGSASSRTDLQASYFLLPSLTKKRTYSTSGEAGGPNFAVPIFDVTGVCGLNGVPGETIFILPGPLFGGPGFLGRFDFRIASKLQGAEANGRFRWLENLFGLAGLRWVQLNESLVFKAYTQTVDNVPFPGGFFNFIDRFSTWNNFAAAQLGLEGRYQKSRWRLEGAVKGALGAMLQSVKIRGSSRTSGGNLFFATSGTANEVLPGGIFAEPTNSGSHRRARFAGAFEAKAKVGCEVTRTLQINVGYTFLWLNEILRPGKQIDRKINTTLTALADASRATVGTGPGPIPFGNSAGAPSPRGSKKPSVLFSASTFYAQGLEAGAVLTF